MRRHNALMIAFVFIFGGGAVVWAMTAPLEGAVIANGVLVVENNVKKVQHPTGGIVGILNVREDQHVHAGDVLVRLDDTTTRANLEIIVNELTALRARMVRLEAERDGQNQISFSPELLIREQSASKVAETLEGERRAFAARLKTRQIQKEQLQERVLQLRQQIDGLKAQGKSAAQQLAISREELADLADLDKKGLVLRQRMTTLKKEISQSEGVLGDNQAKIAEVNGKISETKLQIIQVDRDVTSEATKDLRDIEVRVRELEEKKIAAEDQMARIDIRAPISGRIHQLSVHTVGGVITAAEPAMLIVPENDTLVVEAHISPSDIDQVQIDQHARVRFSAFNQRTTPEVQGLVFRVSADINKDPQNGSEYFTVGVILSPSELAKLNQLKLMSGMPAEVFITTGERTFASYLVKPIMDQMQRSMKEE